MTMMKMAVGMLVMVMIFGERNVGDNDIGDDGGVYTGSSLLQNDNHYPQVEFFQVPSWPEC